MKGLVFNTVTQLTNADSMANSVDPDQTAPYSADPDQTAPEQSDLGLHCLLSTVCPNILDV